MSGIFGYLINSDKQFNISKEFRRTHLWNKAYGRDAEEILSADNFSLGCYLEKLSKTTPVSSPVLNDGESLYAVIDAVIYNRSELVSLFNIRESMSDEEIIFHITKHNGYNSLSKINGDFAGAIYDISAKEITLFCDHIGIRQLYYYSSDSFFLFSTDIRGILSSTDVDVSPNPDWVHTIFNGQTLNNPARTEFDKIFRVAPASYITFKYDESKPDSQPSISENKFWRIGSKKIKLSSFDEYKEKLYELTRDAVKIRANATSEKIGAELSGGMDSGVIDILLNREGYKCVYHSWSMDPSEADYVEKDERLVIKDVCNQENITCHYSPAVHRIGNDSKMNQHLLEIGYPFKEEETVYQSYALLPHMNTLALCNTAEYMSNQGCNIIFTGHGGDEGVSHRCYAYELFYHKEYYHYLKIMWSRTQGQKFRIIKTLKKCREDIKNNRQNVKHPFVGPFSAPEFLNSKYASNSKIDFASTFNFAYDSAAYVAGTGTQNRLLNVALYGAYNGVRYVFPYLDYRLVDYAVSIPRHLFVNRQWNRLIFREAFKDIMPKSMYSLRTKEDFSRSASSGSSEEEFDWTTYFKECFKYTINELDLEIWGKFLDTSKIEKLKHLEGIADDDYSKYESILYCLDNCLYLQSAVEKARSLPI